MKKFKGLFTKDPVRKQLEVERDEYLESISPKLEQYGTVKYSIKYQTLSIQRTLNEKSSEDISAIQNAIGKYLGRDNVTVTKSKDVGQGFSFVTFSIDKFCPLKSQQENSLVESKDQSGKSSFKDDKNSSKSLIPKI